MTAGDLPAGECPRCGRWAYLHHVTLYGIGGHLLISAGQVDGQYCLPCVRALYDQCLNDTLPGCGCNPIGWIVGPIVLASNLATLLLARRHEPTA